MPKKSPKSPILENLRLACADEASAVEFMEKRRWGDHPCCPRCGDMDVYAMASKDGERNKNYRWRCRGCKKMYTVRTGTVMEESRLPMRVWVYCFWKACASKKGISALQLSREMEITHKSALFVMHRIRTAMSSEGGPTPKLTGTVEADETYVGGKPRYRKVGKRGRRPAGESNKIPVAGFVARGGDLRLRQMERVNMATVGAAVQEHIDASSRLMTDESSAYTKIGKQFAGGHETTNHSRREYVRFSDRSVHSNTIEGAFSLLKRGIYGTFHSVSKKHLAKYLGEFEFRYNTRYDSDVDRLEKAIRRANNKRLTYAAQVSSGT